MKTLKIIFLIAASLWGQRSVGNGGGTYNLNGRVVNQDFYEDFKLEDDAVAFVKKIHGFDNLMKKISMVNPAFAGLIWSKFKNMNIYTTSQALKVPSGISYLNVTPKEFVAINNGPDVIISMPAFNRCAKSSKCFNSYMILHEAFHSLFFGSLPHKHTKVLTLVNSLKNMIESGTLSKYRLNSLLSRLIDDPILKNVYITPKNLPHDNIVDFIFSNSVNENDRCDIYNALKLWVLAMKKNIIPFIDDGFNSASAVITSSNLSFNLERKCGYLSNELLKDFDKRYPFLKKVKIIRSEIFDHDIIDLNCFSKAKRKDREILRKLCKYFTGTLFEEFDEYTNTYYDTKNLVLDLLNSRNVKITRIVDITIMKAFYSNLYSAFRVEDSYTWVKKKRDIIKKNIDYCKNI